MQMKDQYATLSVRFEPIVWAAGKAVAFNVTGTSVNLKTKQNTPLFEMKVGSLDSALLLLNYWLAKATGELDGR